jgi:hypothetical protein
MDLDRPTLEALLSRQREWSSACVIDCDGNVVAFVENGGDEGSDKTEVKPSAEEIK